MHGLGPDYICDLVTLFIPSHSLRCADCLSLYQPCSKLKTVWGGGAYNGSKLWNALTVFIRNAASLDCFK